MEYASKLLFVLKRVQMTFKHYFLISVKKQCLIYFGRHFFLLYFFPYYTGVYFCFSFLQEVTKLFCNSPPPTIPTTLILYYMLVLF